MMNKKIVLLAGPGDSTLNLYNGLSPDFIIDKAIIERPISKKVLISRRIKKLGLATTIGQILFQLLCVKTLKYLSKKRVKEILLNCDLSTTPIPDIKRIDVSSVNSFECQSILQQINPEIVIVNGTRIISKATLSCIDATFINTHAGITPQYRGVHGAYWALVNDDKENCGVTIHLVDAGIDTGGILLQDKITFTDRDNFTTYPLLQTAMGIILLNEVLDKLTNGNMSTFAKKTSESRLWSHPTIWNYIFLRISKGIK